MGEACQEFVPSTSISPLHLRPWLATWRKEYTLVFHIVDFFLASVAEEFIMEHDILPSDGFVEFEFDLIYFVARLHVDEEIGVIEDGIDEQVWWVLDIVDPASGWLDEHILCYSTLALLQQHPAMHSLPEIEIRRELIRLVIIDGERLGSEFFLGSFLIFDDSAIEGGMRDAFGEDGLIQIKFFLDIFILIWLS